MTDQPLSPNGAARAMDPRATAFNGGRFALVDLYLASMQAGGGAVIEGRTFTDCTIDGPALMLVLENVSFDRTNFGPTGGNMRNMLFRPMADMAIGAIPVRNCTFTNCKFQALGITGNDQLLNMLIEQVATVDSGQT
ncbi:MAG: hypothetical protein KKC29_12600 [Alphaproteobacteria bacterium]|jgi:hypothetical protein|nr:hypothetical protein [Alphaproteobacteria bacterium]MBU2041425.1 hypothetical protein [Alphaproteobacteria bacterium]MBU2126842.1 hypothetical protein [Alphaproteobacteria bacterium]MBU2208300.1 hypothetical protein [Alphaproteobacteria bacterium]MBU2291929.1 hypothetical protein [Alphaproteobacteria bacterium]